MEHDPTTPTTADVDAARRGDHPARASLLRDLQDPWYRLCLSLLGDPDRARDATQETALRFLRQLPDFRGQSRLSTWSMGIAINVVREMRRATGRTTQADDQLAESQPAADDAPDAAASLREERATIRALLAQLPDRQREAVVLRFFEELSVEETAAAMNCAQGTVKATVHQALRTLRKKIEQPT